MLTPVQRRQLILAPPPQRAASQHTRTIVQAGRNMLDQHAEKMACAVMGMDEQSIADEPKTLVALIKPAGDSCNLRCRYCFNHPEQPLSLMPSNVLEKIIRETLEYSSPGATFIMHGGEPLLAGLDFFGELVRLQEKHKSPGQVVRNHVTTNGTLLNEHWGRFFADHDFKVGVSIDGPPEVHDANRVDAAGKGSMAMVLRGIEACQKSSLKSLATISVVSFPDPVPPRELYDFVNSLGITQWRANPCRAPESVEGYGPYIEELFEFWCDNEGNSRIAIINEILAGLLGFPLRTCWMKGSCRKFIGFDPDGTVSPCCEMTLDPKYHYGNILNTPLIDLLEGEKAQWFWNLRAEGDKHCEGCEWTHLCKGGCTFLRVQNGGSLTERDYLCQAYQDTFTRIARRIDRALLELKKRHAA